MTTRPDLEGILLTSMITYPEAHGQALAMGLRSEHFSVSEYIEIFETTKGIYTTGPVTWDAVLSVVGERLRPTAVDLCSGLTVPRKDVRWLVKQVQDWARRRAIILACSDTISSAADETVAVADCLNMLPNRLLDISASGWDGTKVQIKEIMGEVYDELQRRADHKGLLGLTTGLRDLDDATTGVRQGEFWVVGALPGRGKTVFGGQMAQENACSGNPSVIFSLEMSRQELAGRFLAYNSTISAHYIRNPSFIAEEGWPDLRNAVANMADWPLYVDDSPSLTIDELVARARLFIRRFRCELIVVDYLRLIKAPGKELRERVSNAADAFRQLAKTEKVGVVALSQLARPRDHNMNSKPTMLDLKESGDIEAHADVVLLLHTPMENEEPTGKDEVIIGKNRHGIMGSVPVLLNRKRLKFVLRDVQG